MLKSAYICSACMPDWVMGTSACLTSCSRSMHSAARCSSTDIWGFYVLERRLKTRVHGRTFFPGSKPLLQCSSCWNFCEWRGTLNYFLLFIFQASGTLCLCQRCQTLCREVCQFGLINMPDPPLRVNALSLKKAPVSKHAKQDICVPPQNVDKCQFRQNWHRKEHQLAILVCGPWLHLRRPTWTFWAT